MDFITDFLSRTLGARLAVLISSSLPLTELKGAIVLGRASNLDFFETLLLAFLGSFSVFFVLYFLYKPLLSLLKKIKPLKRASLTLDAYCSNLAKRKFLSDVDGNSNRTVWSKFTVLVIFVAFPAPMTGVWTGTLIAVYSGLNFGFSALAIGIGNLIAGLIISVLAELFLPYLNIIFAVILLVALTAITVFIVKVIRFSERNKETA